MFCLVIKLLLEIPSDNRLKGIFLFQLLYLKCRYEELKKSIFSILHKKMLFLDYI